VSHFRISKEWAPLPLRLMLGVGFFYHGWLKVFSPGGHQLFAGMLGSLGLPAPELTAWLVAWAEIVGGLALIAGAFVAIVSAVLIVDMLVAMFTVHLPSGFNFINITAMGKQGPVFGMPGAEVNLLYIAGLLALVIGGAGAWSAPQAPRSGSSRRTYEPSPRSVVLQRRPTGPRTAVPGATSSTARPFATTETPFTITS
jgi:putative oxidoreductase